jgi:phage head maturation protease
MSDFQQFFQLTKFDPFLGKFTAIAAMGGVVDRTKERLLYPESKPYFEKWSQSQLDASLGKSQGNVRLQHDPKKPVGKLDNIVFDDTKQTIKVEGTVVDPVAKELMREGVLTGVSIGGAYVRKTVGADGITDYVASPNEISVVDRPCLPQGTFEVVKNEAGEVELRKFASEETSASLIEKYLAKESTMSAETEKALFDKIDALQKAVDVWGEAIKKYAKAESVADVKPPVETVLPNPQPNEETDGDIPPFHKECSEKEACHMCESCVKREFSDKEREDAASAGQALPDGSFPIKSVQDLKNAIRAIGRAKDPAKAKAHIKARAKALGASDLIPDTWKADGAEKSDFSSQITEGNMSKELTVDELQKAHKAVVEHIHGLHKAASMHKAARHAMADAHEAEIHEHCAKIHKAITGEDTVPMQTTKEAAEKTDDLKKDAPITDEKIAEIVAATLNKALGVEEKKAEEPKSLEERIAKAVAAAIEPLTKSDPRQPRPRFVAPAETKQTPEDAQKLAKSARNGNREAVTQMFAETARQQMEQMEKSVN